jgi:hypothetical protein
VGRYVRSTPAGRIREDCENLAMRPILLSLLLPLLGLAVAACGGPASSSAEPPPARGTALLELFTSQGCSSCPPADRLLTRLAEDPRYRGRIVPLAFHVDYWNYIGWTDPFSSSAWSQRQQAYAHAFRSSRIYTPQAVINGRDETNGSDERTVTAALDRALAEEPAARLGLRLDPPAGGKVRATIAAEVVHPGEGSGGDLDVWVALYQNHLTTPVGAGENARSTLRNDRVVRHLERAFPLAARAGSHQSGEIELALMPGVAPADQGVAVFVADPKTAKVWGAVGRAVAGS